MSDYLIKSALCLLVLWGFYKIALEQLSAHVFKRFYLIFAVVIALMLPLLTITYSVSAVPQQTEAFQYITPQQGITSEISEKSTDWLPIMLWAIYGIGMCVFAFRFLRNIAQIRSKIRQNVHVFTQNAVHILVEGNIVPHTFLNYIFFSRAMYDSKKIPLEILRHEQAHVTQKHTLDILFIEILQVVFWFNPLFIFIKKSIALNHEFLADKQALESKENPENYINLLLQHAQGAHHAPMTSALNYSLTRPPYRRAKKRILMISQSFSARKLATRLAFLLPILAFCIYFFNQEIVAKPVANKISAIGQVEKNLALKINISGEKINVNGKVTTLENFAETIDAITADWTKDEMMNYTIQLQTQNRDDQLIGKLTSEFHKTKLYKTNPSKELIPPPPPPAPAPAPTPPSEPETPNQEIIDVYEQINIVIDKSKNILVNNQKTTLADLSKTLSKFNSPYSYNERKENFIATISTDSKLDGNFLDKVIKKLFEYGIKGYDMILYDTKKTTAKNLKNAKKSEWGISVKSGTADSTLEQKKVMGRASANDSIKPKTLTGKASDKSSLEPISVIGKPTPQVPPTPPTPPSPLKMVDRMTAAGADFYYNGNKISAKKAQELFKAKENLNFLSTEGKNGGKPMVLITDK